MGLHRHFIYLMTLLLSLGQIPSALAAPLSPSVQEQQQLTDISIIRGIINYTRWPTPPHPLHICIVEENANPETEIELVQRLSRALPSGWPANIRLIQNVREPLTDCHIIYINSLTAEARQQLIKDVTEKPILTIAQETDACSAGIMFCLIGGEKIRFMANLDAIARSPLRINPQVLRLSYRQTTDSRP